MKLISLIAVLLVSCDPLDMEFGDGPLVQTDASSYVISERDGILEVDIPFSFDNRLPQPIYLQRCGARLLPVLEREAGGEWRTEWNPFESCFPTMSPLVIAIGTVYADTARIYAFPVGDERVPQFRSASVTGTYRFNWVRALRSFDYASSPPGDQLPLRHRISNAFQLRGP